MTRPDAGSIWLEPRLADFGEHEASRPPVTGDRHRSRGETFPMLRSFLMAGPGPYPPARRAKRAPARHGAYRAVVLITTFAMLFGGLLLMPMSAAAASAVATDRVNLRSGPSLDADVLTVIPTGASVSVDGDAEAGYYPVTYSGTSGYASVDFIQIGGSVDEDTSGDDTSGGDAGSGDVTGGAPTGSAWVSTDRLNFRTSPSLSSSVITVLSYGDAVTLTGQQSNGYWQAEAAGTTGWLSADYLTTGGAPGGSTDTGNDDTSSDDSSNGSVGVGDAVTGSATVTANLNLRSGPGTSYGVVVVMPAGASVELRGDAQSGYYPLSYNGSTGWAAADWISVGSTPEPTPDPDTGNDGGSIGVGDTATGSATVTENLNLRSGPGTSYGVVTVMRAGSAVELRGDLQNGYYPLSYNGSTGWAAADWLNVGAAPDPTPDPDPGAGDDGSVAVGDAATGSATVTSGLNLRQGPDTSYAVVTVMPAGASVELRGDAQNGFYPLSFNGTTGWASGDWLTIGSTTPDPAPDPGDDGDGVGVGDTATGSATVAENLNLRTGPGTNYDVILVMQAGASVELRGDPQNGYYPLSFNGTTGWAAADWLNIGGSDPGPDPDPGETPDPGTGAHPDYLYTEVSVNMRSAPTTNSSIVWTIPPQTRVTITGPIQNGWYPTAWAHVTGYMNADFLVASLDADVPADQQWVVDIIYAAADRYGQPREDMVRVAMCESHLDPSAVNMDYANDNDRASGLFQFRPSTWATTPYADQDIFDAEANANAAAWMWSVGRRNEWACQ
jgi:mannosyl-glycoprotein endo-beta-N-acetylglucosaminidase